MGRFVPPIFACLTLGLAPFVPEPHVWGKLRWVAGGAVGMGLMDWGDLLFHGAPFVWLLAVVVSAGLGRKAGGEKAGGPPS